MVQFNISDNKEQQLIDLWIKHKNKSINIKTNNESINIKLSEICECYIGEKVNEQQNINSDTTVDYLKNIFGIFHE
jgi:hypothetical protein